MLTIQALGRPDDRTAAVLAAINYPPARVVTAIMALLGEESITGALTNTHEFEGRTHVNAVVLTPTRIISCNGEGPPAWELGDGFLEDSEAEATARRTSDIASMTTLPGKEWANLQTLYSVLGVRLAFRDGTELTIPEDGFKWGDQFSREQLFAFTSALTAAASP